MTALNDSAGIDAAEQYAQWFLGSREWARQILWAYENPGLALDRVASERDS